MEGCFSQPNGVMCQKMVSWAVDVTRGSQCVPLRKLSRSLTISGCLRRCAAGLVMLAGASA